MLVLERKPGEKIFADGPIDEIIVLSNDRGRVRLGFVAPRSTRIWRDDAVHFDHNRDDTRAPVDGRGDSFSEGEPCLCGLDPARYCPYHEITRGAAYR